MLTYDYILNSIKEYAVYDTVGKKIASWKVEDTAQPVYINCRNCGAPVYGCKCNYCGTHY